MNNTKNPLNKPLTELTYDQLTDITFLYTKLKSERKELNKYYELIEYYIRDKYFEYVPSKMFTDSDYVVLPTKMDSQGTTTANNAAAMFTKQILNLDEESISLNFDAEALKLPSESKIIFNLLGKSLTKILQVYIKDESKGFMNIISEAANYLICEGTVGVTCFVDEIRRTFVFDIIPPHNLYYASKLGGSPEQIFYSTEMTGTQLLKEYAVVGVDQNTTYPVIFYYRPTSYDLKDVPGLSAQNHAKQWRLSMMLPTFQNEVIYEQKFASRPIFVAKLGNFNRTQYGAGCGIAALNAVILKNASLEWTKIHAGLSLYPPIWLSKIMKYSNNVDGEGEVSRAMGSVNYLDSPEFREALAQGVPNPATLVPATITPETTIAIIQITTTQIAQAFGFATLEESMRVRGDNPTATQITREAFVTDSMFSYKANIFRGVLDGLIRQIMTIIRLTPIYKNWVEQNLQAIIATGIDLENFGIDYYSITEEQTKQSKKAKLFEYIQLAANLNPQLITPEIITAAQEVLDIDKI